MDVREWLKKVVNNADSEPVKRLKRTLYV